MVSEFFEHEIKRGECFFEKGQMSITAFGLFLLEGENMNKGTIIRTILVVASCLNTALMATDVAQFHNETVNLIYRIASVALNFVIVGISTYYNNDYTEEACIGTGVTRKLKEEAKGVDFSGVPADELAELEYIDGGADDE